MDNKVKWTKEQLQAIETSDNNILVAAGAGSGKTAVLVERIINKIINEKIDIDQLLIVTFTNAAASEMRERILEAIYKKIETEPDNVHLQKQINLLGRANICTIDSFCLEVVKNNFYEIGISPNFRIADNAELDLLKQETLEELFEEKYERGDKEFLELLNIYTKYSDDEPLKQLILNIYRFIQSHPFPMEWLDIQIEKYNIDKVLDFSETIWGEIILKEFKDRIKDGKKKLENLKQYINKYNELTKYGIVISEDINILDKLLQFEKWDDIFYFIQEVKFERWPSDKKITLEEKDIAKEKRDYIKDEIKEAFALIDCDSKLAIKDIYEMYKILKCLKNVIFEYDEFLSNNKKEKNILDFSDIEHNALKILLKKDENGKYIPTEIAEKYKKKFIEIAIDEYQDSNLVQESILTSISNGKNIFMVGDVKQSIYKFRQARPELFLDKYERYSSIDNENKISNTNNLGNKIKLFKNFRSRENILDTTNTIFKNIMSKDLGDIEYCEEEYLNIGANFGEAKEDAIFKNTQICVIETKENEEIETEGEDLEEPIENIELEAKYTANKIKELLESKQVILDKKIGYRPITYKDIVILLRSTKDRANIFENELINLGIPVYSDTSLEYLNSIEIQTIMNLLKVIDNPTVDIPLVAVLRSMIGGFSDNELITIRLTDRNKSFYESMLQYSEQDEIKEKIDIFLNKVSKWQEEIEYLELDEFIWKIYIDTGYYNYVSLMPDGILRVANLKLLFEKAKQYDKASFKGLYNFINFIDKVKNSSGDLGSAKLIGENENVVRIMSIHKSKGLEFPVVFLCNSNKKVNMQDLNEPILLHQDLGIGANYIDNIRKIEYETVAKQAIKLKAKKEIISEEMRILYVALTRAKERLIITGVSQNLEEDLKKKKKELGLYKKEEKVNINILKKYKSYLDWIELAYLNSDNCNIMSIEKISKEDISINKEEILNYDIESIKKKTEGINEKNVKEIEDILNWEYSYKELSNIEGKSSVSKIKNNNKENHNNIIVKQPEFSKEKKLTGAQKGTLIHLCMQNLDVKEEYNFNKIKELIQQLVLNRHITDFEAKNININKILTFTKSNIWKELKTAKLIEREKTFYISIPAKEIYETNLEEKILIQGIIDLFYINENDELILVDYKTDFVESEKELISKYYRQLELYKKALEADLNKSVNKIYIYSTYMEKEIELTI